MARRRARLSRTWVSRTRTCFRSAVIDEKAQGAIEVLAGPEHDGEFARGVGDVLAGELPWAAEIGAEHGRKRARGAVGKFGANGEAALAAEQLYDRLLAWRVQQPGRRLARGQDGGVAEARHQEIKDVLFWNNDPISCELKPCM